MRGAKYIISFMVDKNDLTVIKNILTTKRRINHERSNRS